MAVCLDAVQEGVEDGLEGVEVGYEDLTGLGALLRSDDTRGPSWSITRPALA